MACPIEAAHMLEFMHDSPVQVLCFPSLRVGREHDRRTHEAAGHRCGQRFVQQDFHTPLNAGIQR